MRDSKKMKSLGVSTINVDSSGEMSLTGRSSRMVNKNPVQAAWEVYSAALDAADNASGATCQAGRDEYRATVEDLNEALVKYNALLNEFELVRDAEKKFGNLKKNR